VIVGDRRRESFGAAVRHALWSIDYMSLAMLLLYSVVFFREVPGSLGILQINILSIIAVVAFAMWYDQSGTRFALVARSFYILPLGYMMYSQVHNYIPLVHPHNFDTVLAAWDRSIFGVNPTEWIGRFATPVLTEYLQIWYNLFQLMLIVPAAGFFRTRYDRFLVYSSTLLLGFYLSYILYFVMPAIGPRFEVHDFYSTDRELPGLVLTKPLRNIINAGNNIPTDHMDNPYDFVNRDCMPSGHTMMSLLAILMCWRYRSRWRWLITIGGTSIIVATVYLRYHYVVDLIAGGTLAIVLFLAHRTIFGWWQRVER
jgi:membrane-associated phospholipid phosphatase